MKQFQTGFFIIFSSDILMVHYILYIRSLLNVSSVNILVIFHNWKKTLSGVTLNTSLGWLSTLFNVIYCIFNAAHEIEIFCTLSYEPVSPVALC